MQLNGNHYKASLHNHLTEPLPTMQPRWPLFSVYFIKSFISLVPWNIFSWISSVLKALSTCIHPCPPRMGLLSSSVLCPWVTQHRVYGEGVAASSIWGMSFWEHLLPATSSLRPAFWAPHKVLLQLYSSHHQDTILLEIHFPPSETSAALCL